MCSTTWCVAETADLSQPKKKEKKNDLKKNVPVVSEALIGEEKNLGRIFLISLKFSCFFLLVLEKKYTKMCFIYFYFCSIIFDVSKPT